MSITSEINNLFAFAIEMSFAEMGVFDAPALSSGVLFSSEPERQDLIEPFMVSLLEALESQNAHPYRSWIDRYLNEAQQFLKGIHSPQSWADAPLKIANSGTFGLSGYQEHDYDFPGKNDGLETDLQNLIRKVSSIDSGISANKSNNSALFSLLLNFQKLIRFAGRQGGVTPGDIPALVLFLRTLAKNIQGVISTGNFINTVE